MCGEVNSRFEAYRTYDAPYLRGGSVLVVFRRPLCSSGEKYFTESE